MTFYEKMRVVCLAIPQGRVATYGQIAMLCGAPRNSRQVGYGLKRNLAGEDLPAFRVVNSKGILSGAAMFADPLLQQRLLEQEGVEVTFHGGIWRVDLDRYGWQTTREDALAFLNQFEQKENQPGIR